MKILSKYLTNWISSEFSQILEIVGSTLASLLFPASNTLIFLWTGATCASFNLAGNVNDVIARFTIFVKGFVITGLANCKSFGEIQSIPVAFFTLILLIRLPTNYWFISEKEKCSNAKSGWLFLISTILGRASSTFVQLFPMFLTTFTK